MSSPPPPIHQPAHSEAAAAHDDLQPTKQQVVGALPLTQLPNEVLAHIFDFLLPTVLPTSSTYPNPRLETLDNAFSLPSSTVADLSRASLVSTAFHHLALEALWRAPVLKSLRAIRTLAEAIELDAASAPAPARGRSRKAAMIRALYLPAADGVLEADDALADQNAYQASLRTIFDHADRLECISVGHRPAGRAFFELFHPRTRARPRNAILSNLSYSSPPFAALDLTPLCRVAHLHLINIVPSPTLISFLCGKPIDTDADAARPAAVHPNVGPSQALTHLRLSLLPPDSLLSFRAYIEWRRASDAHEKLPTHVRLNAPPPRAPQGPARRFAAQEALYTLATHSHLLPRLRVLLLELVALHPLSPPERFEDEEQGGHTAALPNAEGDVDAAGRLSTTNFPADLPVTPAGAERVDAETLRTGPRDLYWDQVEAGKRALIDLWNGVERGTSANADAGGSGGGDGQPADSASTAAERETATDIRIVASRPGGHDKYEGILDFLCQSGCFTSLAPAASQEDAAAAASFDETEAADDVGSWADPDIFDVAKQRPHLSYRSREGHKGEDSGDWRGQGAWWTGELPRIRRPQTD
ncbi:hypothetical protein ACQY0O_008055 [Thecaphora frezii]